MTTKILAKQRDPNAGKVADVLKKSGFDLATGVREIAMCQQANEEPVIGIALTVANTLGLLKDMAVSVGEQAPPITEKKGAKILATGKITFAQPMAGVVVLGEPAAIDSALDKKGGDGFADARG